MKTSPYISGLVVLVAALVAAPALALDVDYTLDLPARQKIRYEVDFEVVYPGTLSVELDWDTSRILSFRVEAPDETSFRRSGPPPLRLHVGVSEDGAAADRPWKLTILGLPSRTSASGTLRVILPEPPEIHVEPDPATTPVPETEMEPWMRPVDVPAGVTPQWRRAFEATEALRALVVDADEPAPDSCRWQAPLLGFLHERLEAWNTGAGPVDAPTAKMLLRIARAAEEVGTLENTRDPLLTEPRPEDPARRRAWKTVRRTKLEPIRGNLDTLFSDLQTGYAPALEREAWPARFVTCLMACERQFEERTGGNAPDTDMLTEVQWPRIQAAAEAMTRLAEAGGR